MRAISKVNTSPSDVQPRYYFALKIVAVAGHYNDWACYIGPSDWDDEDVARSGDKVLEEQAGVFAYLMQLRRYRS